MTRSEGGRNGYTAKKSPPPPPPPVPAPDLTGATALVEPSRLRHSTALSPLLTFNMAIPTGMD